MKKKISSTILPFSNKITEWYKNNKRDLPWRHTNDPYVIWLSEVILQQTRVAQGLPYFERFLVAFPTVQRLADATQEEVLRLWQGLGYYSRARNMHATARIIAYDHDGVFPTTYNELLKLKGIGPYTAAAVASFAFGEAVAVVDGNVYRVLARVFGISTDISGSSARKEFEKLANELILKDEPALFNQAIMEFGALKCTPQKPDCMFCPLQADCYAFQHQAQNRLPIKLQKTKVTDRYFTYIAVEVNGKYLLRKRVDGNVWSGLYEFYLVESTAPLTSPEDITDNFIEELLPASTNITLSAAKKHVLSHQRIYANFWQITVSETVFDVNKKMLSAGYSLYSRDEITELPKSILVAGFAEKLLV